MTFEFAAPRRPSTGLSEPDVTIASRAMALAPHLPCGPFTERTFLDHAIGLNAVTNVAEATLLRAYLADVGMIVRHGSPSDMWVIA